MPPVAARACNTLSQPMITLRLNHPCTHAQSSAGIHAPAAKSDSTPLGQSGDTSPDTAKAPSALRIHGVVFDMDGLLFDTERLYRMLLQERVRAHGHELTDDGYRRMIGHRIDISKQVLAEEIGTSEPVDAIFDELESHYYNAVSTRAIPTRPGALELITLLRQHGVPLALATSTFRHLTDAKLRNAGLADAFALTVCGDEVEHSKPHPEPYLKAAAGLDLWPSQVLALEDSPTGLTAAHTAGLHTILVPDLVEPTETSIAMADAVADSLLSVCQWIESGPA